MVLDSQRSRPGQYSTGPQAGLDSSAAAPRGQYTEMTQRSYPSGTGQGQQDSALVDQYSTGGSAGAAGVPTGASAGAGGAGVPQRDTPGGLGSEVSQGAAPGGSGVPQGNTTGPADQGDTEGHYVRGPNGQFVDWVGPKPEGGSDKQGQHKGLGAKVKGIFGHSHGGKQE